MVRGQRRSPAVLYTIFIILAVISIVLNIFRLVSSVKYYQKCQPDFVAVSQEDFDKGNYRHPGDMTNPVDENSSEAKESLKIAKKDFKSSDWYNNELRESKIYLFLSIISCALTVVALLAGIIVSAKTNLTSNKSRVLFGIVLAVAVITLVYAVYTNSSLDYVQKFTNPVIHYVVPAK